VSWIRETEKTDEESDSASANDKNENSRGKIYHALIDTHLDKATGKPPRTLYREGSKERVTSGRSPGSPGTVAFPFFVP
jgi:hypothetical protein